eukprot:scaffold204716_cov17-Tisochrysis_lutea.AAC.3
MCAGLCLCLHRPQQPALARAGSTPQAAQKAQTTVPVPAQLQPQTPLPQMSAPPPAQSSVTQPRPPSTASTPPPAPRPALHPEDHPSTLPPPRPAAESTSLATPANTNNILTGGANGQFAPGPLLLFPDTSALLSMLGCNVDLPRYVPTLFGMQQGQDAKEEISREYRRPSARYPG